MPIATARFTPELHERILQKQRRVRWALHARAYKAGQERVTDLVKAYAVVTSRSYFFSWPLALARRAGKTDPRK